MAFALDRQFEHLLRRAGFGARSDELDTFRRLSFRSAVDRLLRYEDIPDDVDEHLLKTGYVQITQQRDGFQPSRSITDARQRWLFRMVHTNRPLQEKMTLFWHNHFATAYGKVAGSLNAAEATRYMAAKASDGRGQVRGQVEMLRDNALGNFRDLLIEIAKDTAMLVWLDGRNNVRGRPQENFGRELMELFTMGVGHYTEADVYAAARVFTGWNLTGRAAAQNDVNPAEHLSFAYVPGAHDTDAKTFSFPIYRDGGKTIPGRAAAAGMQDGLDLIDGLAAHPETPRYLGTKLYRFFISETGNIDDKWLNQISLVYSRTGYDMQAVMREVLLSGEFWDQAAYFARYSWPVEFVVRALKDIGWSGFGLGEALTALGNMGQNLYDPPDVAGWEIGQQWFSTGSMLARMNFASTLAGNQRFNLQRAVSASGSAATPESLLAYVLNGLPAPDFDNETRAELLNYLTATGAWTGSTAQLQAKTSGLVHLVAGSPEYQLV